MQVGVIDVADGGNFDPVNPQGRIKMVGAAIPYADEAKSNGASVDRSLGDGLGGLGTG